MRLLHLRLSHGKSNNERIMSLLQMVENYLKDNGLTDRVKILRIYDMSFPRGAAHHTCNLAPVRGSCLPFVHPLFSRPPLSLPHVLHAPNKGEDAVVGH